MKKDLLSDIVDNMIKMPKKEKFIDEKQPIYSSNNYANEYLVRWYRYQNTTTTATTNYYWGTDTTV